MTAPGNTSTVRITANFFHYSQFHPSYNIDRGRTALLARSRTDTAGCPEITAQAIPWTDPALHS